jgi:hypothetical protein
MNSVYIKEAYSTLQNKTQKEYWEDPGVDARIEKKKISEE